MSSATICRHGQTDLIPHGLASLGWKSSAVGIDLRGMTSFGGRALLGDRTGQLFIAHGSTIIEVAGADTPVERLEHTGPSPLGGFGVGLTGDDVDAVAGAHLGDARAHQPDTDHPDSLDRVHGRIVLRPGCTSVVAAGPVQGPRDLGGCEDDDGQRSAGAALVVLRFEDEDRDAEPVREDHRSEGRDVAQHRSLVEPGAHRYGRPIEFKPDRYFLDSTTADAHDHGMSGVAS